MTPFEAPICYQAPIVEDLDSDSDVKAIKAQLEWEQQNLANIQKRIDKGTSAGRAQQCNHPHACNPEPKQCRNGGETPQTVIWEEIRQPTANPG